MATTIKSQNLKWKLKDGTLVPINELSNEELQAFRKIAKRNTDDFYNKYQFFAALLENMDDELHKRIEDLKLKIQTLEEIEQAV